MNLRRVVLSLISVLCVISVQAQAKYIFYFIGDGMGIGAVTTAEAFVRQTRGEQSRLTMTQLPVASLATTFSASSPVTDSAAAGTALATGKKTRNGMLGVTPDSAAAVSIATKLHEAGYGVGLVTTVAPDDATPGAFYAHQPSRSMYYEIGRDAAASGFEFIAGGNLRGYKGNDLMAVLEESGMAVVRGMDQLKETESRRIFLLDKDTTRVTVPYAVDSLEGYLTLPDMTQACLDHLLKNSPERFFMMVEGGSIDHAAHGNDAAATIVETVNFDNALKIAYQFYLQHPTETLIVVTADHETGGMIYANAALHYYAHPEYLPYVRMSKEKLSEYCKSILGSRSVITWDDMKRFLSDRLGLFSKIPVSESDEQTLRQLFDETFEKRQAGADQHSLYASFNQFAVECNNIINRAVGIGWTTMDHSGTAVPVFAAGRGAFSFSRMLDNTEIPALILRSAGL